MTKRKVLLSLVAIAILVVTSSVSAQDSGQTVLIGLSIVTPDAFIEEMVTLGYVEGENVEYMILSLEEVPPEQILEQIQIQTQLMIDAPVDLLVVTTDTDALNMRALMPDIPIIFTISDDPIATGTVNDLTLPGNGTTGLVSNQHHPRRLQLLTEIDPGIQRVYYFYSATAIEGVTILEQVQELGRELGVEVVGTPVSDVPTGLEAIENMPEDVDWIFLTPYLPFDLEFNEALVAKSAETQVPIAGFIAAPIPGYVIDYGPDFTKVARQSATIADRVIRGANAGELPILTAENGLIVNLQVAESMNVEIPESVLRQADLIVRPGDEIPAFPGG